MAITSMVRIFASVAMIVFAGAVVASATGAFFSDEEVSQTNTFAAGTLDLEVDGGFGFATTTPFTVSDLMPGDTGSEDVPFTVDNDAWFRVTIDKTASSSGDPHDAFTAALGITPALEGADSGSITLAQDGSTFTAVNPLSPDDTYILTIEWNLPTTTEDVAQAGSANVVGTLQVVQTANNIPNT